MDGWWTLAAGDIEISGPTLYGEATVTGIRVLPLHRSSILRPLCDCLSSHLDSKRRSTAQYPLDPTTVLMDGRPRPRAEAATARSSDPAPWRSSDCLRVRTEWVARLGVRPASRPSGS